MTTGWLCAACGFRLSGPLRTVPCGGCGPNGLANPVTPRCAAGLNERRNAPKSMDGRKKIKGESTIPILQLQGAGHDRPGRQAEAWQTAGQQVPEAEDRQRTRQVVDPVRGAGRRGWHAPLASAG